MQAQLSWLDDPRVFRVNALPARSDHRWYRNVDEMKNQHSSLIESLDGRWAFSFAQSPQQRPRNFYDPKYKADDWDQIDVPSMVELNNYAQLQYINTLYPWEGKHWRRPAGTCEQDGQGDFSHGPDNTVGCYRKHFKLNPAWCQTPVRVRFEGVERAYYVWLNGHFIGYAEDSFAPHEFDLTPYLNADDNLLAVEVFKHSTASWLEDQDMFRFSGIFRSVYLLAQPATHIEDFTLRPILSADKQTGYFNLQAKIVGDPFSMLEVSVADQDGHVVFSSRQASDQQLNIQDAVIHHVHCWSNRHPYLYTMRIAVLNDRGQVIELVPYHFGFRRVAIDDRQVLRLNGRRLIINGVNRHEWDCRRGRCISFKDMQQDLRTMQDNHINAVRTCHYMDQTRWYDLCDQAGIYVMAENNLETHGTWQKMGKVEPSYNVPGSLPEWLPAVLDRARNNYETLKNHTAILFWSLGNESYAGDDLAAMQQFYKQHDPTRLVHYEGVCHHPAYRDRLSDFESRMYWPPADVKNYLTQHPDKPFLECEYMHSMGNSVGGMQSYVDLVKQYPQDCGGFIWDFIDQALQVKDPVTHQWVMRYGGDFDDRHHDGAFSGDGLMFANRQPKPAMQEVKYYYGQLQDDEDRLR